MRKALGILLVALTAVAVGCGDDDDNDDSQGGSGGEAAVDAGRGDSASGSGGSGGADASTGGEGGADGAVVGSYDDVTVDLPPEVECAEGEHSCRGACFRDVGEIQNGCELFFLGNREGAYFNALAVDDKAVFVTDTSIPDWLLRIEKADRSTSVLAEKTDPGDDMILHDGYLYLYGDHEYDDVVSNCLVRIPVDGGAIELIYDPGVNSVARPDFEMVGDYIYIFGGRMGLDIVGVLRVPIDEIHADAEAVLDEIEVGDMVADDTHFYWQLEYPDFDIQRSPRDDPGAFEILYGEGFAQSVISAHLFLEPSDPEHLYVFDAEYLRVPKTGGNLESVVERKFKTSGVTAGPQYLLIVDSRGEPAGTFAIPRTGGDVLAIDARDYRSVAEDATHFYLMDRRAIFRVAKPAS